MRKKIEDKIEVIEALKNDVISNLNKLTPSQLSFKPNNNKWSLVQVIEHLTLAETSSLNYVNKKILDPTVLLDNTFTSKFRAWLLKIFFTSPIKVKRRPVMVSPTDSPDYQNVLLRWDIARKALKQFIDEQSDEILDKLIYKHPFAGRLNAYQMLCFFENHIKHHQKQMNRIKNHKNYPTL